MNKDWKKLSEAASHERDPEKLLKLVEQLDHALEECENAIKQKKNGLNKDGLNKDGLNKDGLNKERTVPSGRRDLSSQILPNAPYSHKRCAVLGG